MNITLDVTQTTGHKALHVTTDSGFALWNNPADLISEEVRKKAGIVVSLFIIPLFTLLGLPGNIISAVVFYRQGLRERINVCLFALSIVDLVVVVILFLPYFESQIRDLFVPSAWYFAANTPGTTGFVWASQFLSAVIASERCFCVVSPFHAKRLLKTSTMAAIIVVCCLVLVGGMAAIAGPKHTVITSFDPTTNTSKEIFYVTRYYLDNKDILDVVDIFVYATCLPGIFLLVIVITTFITIIRLQSAATQRKGMTNGSDRKPKTKATPSSREVAVTRMLIGTSILFIICLTPNFVGQVTTFIVPDLSFSGKYFNTNMVMWLLIALLRVINCSVNICVYYALGSKFRQTFHELCGCSGNKTRQDRKKYTDGQTDFTEA